MKLPLLYSLSSYKLRPLKGCLKHFDRLFCDAVIKFVIIKLLKGLIFIFQDVIDWILENIINKTRTRRGVLKKLKELGLMFKAPTKKSTASGARKNLWQTEEDEELRSLYDQYRLEADCLQRILSEFEDRRSKQQIISRMLQLHIIADKSEILPAKAVKRSSKKKRNKHDFDEEQEDMVEPTFSNMATKISSKKKKNLKLAKRKIVRTTLDVGTVRALVAQVDAEKYQEAIDWLKECLEEAAEDSEDPSEEDDGVPLLPLQEVQKEAMENDDFKKVLLALGVQPPILGMENYWRIPIYLNAADLKLRAKIIASVELEINIAEDDLENNEEESDVENFDIEEEEDYLEKQQRVKINSLMFTQSDEEAEERAPLASKKNNDKEQRKKKKKSATEQQEEQLDEAAEVRDIEKKLSHKLHKPYESSSEEETEQMKNEETIHNVNQVFDQLKAKRASKKSHEDNTENLKSLIKKTASEEEITLIEKKLQCKRRHPEMSSDDDEEEKNESNVDTAFNELKSQQESEMKNNGVAVEQEFDFNSENFRGRLFELEDNEVNQVAVRRGAHIYDSDSEHEEQLKNNADDTTDHQEQTANSAANNKRQRSPSATALLTSNDAIVSNDSDSANEFDVSAKIARRSSGKKRRLVVLDDDDD